MNALFQKQYPSNVVPVNYYSTFPPYNYRAISSNSYHTTSIQANAFPNQIVYPASLNQSAPIVSNPISYRGLNIIMISSLVLLSLDLIFVRPIKHRNN